MPKRDPITPKPISRRAVDSMVVAGPYRDAEATYGALRATGMRVPDALKSIGVVDPKGAMRLLDAKWDDLMRDKDPGNGGFTLYVDFRGQDWITGLPEGKGIDSYTDFDLRGCENFVSIPRSFQLNGPCSLKLEGTSWDERIPLMRCKSFQMDFDAMITYGDIGSPGIFTGKEWRSVY